MAVIAELAVNVVAKTSQLSRDLRRAKNITRGFGNSLRRMSRLLNPVSLALGSLGGVATLSGLKAVADELDSLAKKSDRLGVSATDLLSYRHAAELSGISTQFLDKSLEKLNVRLEQASMGQGEAATTLARYNINAGMLLKLPMEHRLGAIADVMAGMNSESEKAAFAVKLFEEEGVQMVTMLGKGSKELRKLTDDYKEFGGAMSRQDLERVERFNDAMTKLRSLISRGVQSIVITISPAATRLLEAYTNPREITDRQRRSKGFNDMVNFFGGKMSAPAIRPDEITAARGSARILDTGAVDMLTEERAINRITKALGRMSTKGMKSMVGGRERAADIIGGLMGGLDDSVKSSFFRFRDPTRRKSSGPSFSMSDPHVANRATLANSAEGFRALHAQNKTAEHQLKELKAQTGILEAIRDVELHDPFAGAVN